MQTEQEIKDKAKLDHDNLSAAFYALTPDNRKKARAKFDRSHGKIWSDMEGDLIAGGYLTVPEPPRDLEAEIDELRAEIEKIKK